jgi:energy-coupling factor transport system permease protein
MMLLEPLTPDPRAPLAHAHPLAKLGAAVVVMAALFVTIDAVTPAITLVGVLAALLLIGVPTGPLVRRAFPLLIAALGIAFFNAVVTGDVATGIALGVRLVGISLAGIVAVATVDPTELADALVQHLHAPRRFTVGALAAFRLMPLFADEWQTIQLARRARGLEDARRVAPFVATARALLVGAIRRATRLAIAMDARGFADPGCRTLARPRSFDRRDWLLLAASGAVAVVASLASVLLGTWRFLLST